MCVCFPNGQIAALAPCLRTHLGAQRHAQKKQKRAVQLQRQHKKVIKTSVAVRPRDSGRKKEKEKKKEREPTMHAKAGFFVWSKASYFVGAAPIGGPPSREPTLGLFFFFFPFFPRP